MIKEQAMKPEERLRWGLPYGMWVCANGREVLFNRHYAPIWERSPGMSAKEANHGEMVPYVKAAWIFFDENPPWRNKETRALCDRILADFLCGEPIDTAKWHAPLGIGVT